jgi:voltage-gated potassium channel
VAVVTARELRPDLAVASHASDPAHAARLRRMRLDEVVVPALLGGLRLGSEAIRPAVVEFLDGILGREAGGEETALCGLAVAEGAPAAGKTLVEAGFGGVLGVEALALREPGHRDFAYNPAPDRRLAPGATVAFLADGKRYAAVRAALAPGAPR